MFLHLSVILSTGGCLPQCMLGYIHPHMGRHPPLADTPPGQTPSPLADTPEQTPLQADTTQADSPPDRHPRADTPLPADGYYCGRCASYWNAFLFLPKKTRVFVRRQGNAALLGHSSARHPVRIPV